MGDEWRDERTPGVGVGGGGGGVTEIDFESKCELTVAGVRVTQRLLGVQSDADVASVGGRRAVTGARALVVTAAATHGALGPGRPAGPRTFNWNTHKHTNTPSQPSLI